MIVVSSPSRDLITRAYHDILVPSFPPDELVGLPELFQPDTVVRVAMVGTTVAGVFVYDLFAHGRVALCSYLAVRPQLTGVRLGHAIMANLMREVGGYDLVLGEVEVPGSVPATSNNAARQRVMMFERMGLNALDVPFFQPAVRAGQPRINPMLLVLVHSRSGAVLGDDLLGGTLASFIAEYLTRAEGIRGVLDEDATALLSAARPPVRIVSLSDRIDSHRLELDAAS